MVPTCPTGQVFDDAPLHYGQVFVAKCVHGIGS